MAQFQNKPLWDLTSADFPPTDESGDIDLEQIEYNLSLTPDQRMQQYFAWLDFMQMAQKAGRDFYGMEHRVSQEIDCTRYRNISRNKIAFSDDGL